MLTTQNQPVKIGDALFDHLSTAVAHVQSAQFFVTQGDREAVGRWIDEATLDLEAARAVLDASGDRELRRPVHVTGELAERDV